jgi:hypothetical protein
LEAAEDEPETLPRFLILNLLPDKLDVHDRVKALLDKRPTVSEKSEDAQEKSWQSTVREWLMTHSRYLRDELVKEASTPYEADGYIHNERFLYALARLDWERAQPVLETLRASGKPRRVALALALQYEHALETQDATQAGSLREQLMKLTANKEAPGYARAKACEVLLKTEWPGREEWYLALFNDASLSTLQDGRYPFNPLSAPLLAQPEKWLPVILKLIGSSNRTVHNTAVSALLAYNGFGRARRETLLPMLPWLSNPNWAEVEKKHRANRCFGN